MMRSSKNKSMFRLKCKPLHALDGLVARPAMVELGSFGDGRQEERHAVMIQRRAPLTHRRMNSVEDMVSIPQRCRGFLAEVGLCESGFESCAGSQAGDEGEAGETHGETEALPTPAEGFGRLKGRLRKETGDARHQYYLIILSAS